MTWVFVRWMVALAVLAAGAAIGYLAGGAVRLAPWGAVLGMALALLLVIAVDALRGSRLLRWLAGEHATPAPRDAGLWAELAYRAERAIRQRDKAIAGEHQRLVDFLSAIEASPNGVVLLDRQEQITWCNPSAADHLGLDGRRDIGQPITNLVRIPAFVGYMQSREWREPLTLTDMGRGTTLQMVVRAYGEQQTLLITQDITERQRAEAMRRDFVANVSHEIRTPLTVLAGFVETMGSLPLSGSERGRVLQLMQQQTDRMQTLVADLLTLAQLEGSPRPAIDRWLALGPLLDRAVADGRTLSAGRHAIGCAAVEGIEVAGQESELFSAVVNLVTNAVRYTPADGRIQVGWRLRGDGQGEIEVSDTGIGIAREHLPRLTERFYRVDGSRSRETGGTGLGLAIVKHVMQRHGGALEVESTPGQGSRFRLVLPAGRVRTALAAAAPERTD